MGAKSDALLDDLERQGPEADFAKRFSAKLPIFTLSEMLGIDVEDRRKVKVWMRHLEMAAQFLSNCRVGPLDNHDDLATRSVPCAGKRTGFHEPCRCSRGGPAGHPSKK